jgi:hypothetical protein
VCPACERLRPPDRFNQFSDVCRACEIASREPDPAPDGFRTCKHCLEVKPVSDFKQVTTNRKKPVSCVVCEKKRLASIAGEKRSKNPDYYKKIRNKYYQNSRHRVAADQRAKKYGVSADEYLRMGEEQGWVCAICGLPEIAQRSGRVMSLAVDHCHETGRVRGLLCGNCNTGLGKVERVGIEKFAAYLVRVGEC